LIPSQYQGESGTDAEQTFAAAIDLRSKIPLCCLGRRSPRSKTGSGSRIGTGAVHKAPVSPGPKALLPTPSTGEPENAVAQAGNAPITKKL